MNSHPRPYGSARRLGLVVILVVAAVVGAYGVLVATGTGSGALGLSKSSPTTLSAQAITGKVGGVHIHVVPVEVGILKGLNVTHTIDITVYGPDNFLTGAGWGANPDSGEPFMILGDSIFQCYYTQQGSITNGVVNLTGIMLFSGNPNDQGGQTITTANLSTGFVRVVFHDMSGTTFTFEGTGEVARI